MPFVLAAVLLLVPLVELFVIVAVGQQIGFWVTFGLLLGTSLLGGVLLKREGTKAWRAVRSTVEAGRLPGSELTDAALVMAGGGLLLAPGFVTDVIGLVCILPLTRPLLRKLSMVLVARQVAKVDGSPGAGKDKKRPLKDTVPGSVRDDAADRTASDSGGAGFGRGRGPERARIEREADRPSGSGIVSGEVVDRHDET